VSLPTDPTRQPIVTARDGEVFANSRDVAEFFEKNHRDVTRAITNLLSQEPDLALRNFTQGVYTLPETGAQEHRMFDMTRDGFALLAMGFTGAKALKWKLRYIEAFNVMEAELRSKPAAAPMTREQILAQAFMIADETIKEQAKEIAALTPKAEALDRIATADGSLCITDAAKLLQVRPTDLFSFLREHRWIYKRVGTDHYVGYQDRTNAGDLEHKVNTILRPDGSERVTEQVRITPRGLAKLAKLMPGRLKQILGGKAA
jgi:Rha family phage regulatory protein